MGWYGTTLAALVAAAVGGALTFARGRPRAARARARAGARWCSRIARAGGLILVVDFVYFGWTLTHQTPKPLGGDLDE